MSISSNKFDQEIKKKCEFPDISRFIDLDSLNKFQFRDKEAILAVENMSNSKSPSTPVSSQMITTTARSMTPNPTQTTPDAQRIQSNSIRSTNYKEDLDSSPQINMKIEQNYDESINTLVEPENKTTTEFFFFLHKEFHRCVRWIIQIQQI